MLNGFGRSERNDEAWEAAGHWLAGLAAAETEASVLHHLQTLLATLGLFHALYLQAHGSAAEVAVFQPIRAWRLTGPAAGLPLPMAAPPLPVTLLVAGPPRDLSPDEVLALLSHLDAPVDSTGMVLPLRVGRRHLGTLLVLSAHGGQENGSGEGLASAGGPALLGLLSLQAAVALEHVRSKARLSVLGHRVRALGRADIGLFQTDRTGRVVWYNARFQEIAGLKPRTGQDLWADLVLSHGQQHFEAWWKDGLLGRPVPRHQFALPHPDGGVRWAEVSSTALYTPGGQLSGQVGTLEDVTERRTMQERLTFQAQHDSLTQLPNRIFLEQVWPQLLQSAERDNTVLALLFIDLERFKQVNDSLGHQVGDQLLMLLARRLQGAVGNGGVVARHGGDEFVVLLRGLKSGLQAQEKAQALFSAVRTPLRIDHHLLQVSCRIGMSLYPQDAADLETLLQHADAAMYRLKHARQTGVLVYKNGMSGGELEQLDLETEFRTALDAGGLRLHYQPQHELAGGRQVGWEALVRWQHPRLGLLPSGSFLPMVATAGLLTQMGDWVIAETHRQLVAWAAQGLPLLPVAVNVDARQLAPGHLTGLIGKLMKAQPLPPGLLELEINEETLPSDIQTIDHDLRQLKAAGVTVAIDDFGRGFSNLGQMQRLRVDRIKIDRDYVLRLESSASDRAIVQAAISMGHALGARVLAEGVETVGQLEVLQSLGCDEGQGFLWAPARPPEELEWD